MGNYKIRVANEAESKEVQEFLKSNGYERKIGNFKLIDGWVCINEKMMILCVSVSQAGDELNEYKELTLPQLKDLVILKRNDATNCTHWHVTGQANLPYLFAMNEWYFFGRNGWEKSTHNQEFYNRLKPIEPQMSILDTGRLEMKEYLRKDLDGKYILELTTEDEAKEPHAKGWIEVPVGADTATIEKENAVYFWNEANNTTFADGVWNICDEFNFVFLSNYLLDNNNRVIWKRETLNDKVASAEVVRDRRKTYGFTPEIASRISLKTEGAYMAVSETLKARESTYGSFEDVASVTQDLLSILKRTGLESLPKPHKEAMHMICSKMARIVNGDFNHLDSWHDIGGYAKLIENLIGDENENRSEN